MTTAITLQHIHSSNSNSTSITDIEVGLPFSSRPVSGVDLFIFPSACWPVEREREILLIIIIIRVIITLDFITRGNFFLSLFFFKNNNNCVLVSMFNFISFLF